MNEEPQRPSDSPPTVYPPAPGVVYPESSPSQPPTQFSTVSTEPPAPKRSLKIIILAAILVLALAGGAYAFYQSRDKNTSVGGTISLDGSEADVSFCMPIVATDLSKQSAITTYERFSIAVAENKQSCADDLSSRFFLNYIKLSFGITDGNWISERPLGQPPTSDFFSELPSNFEEASFKQKDYTRATVAGMDQSANDMAAGTTGTTLSYPVDLSGVEGFETTDWQITISFVLENGYVKVDDYLLEPRN